ncbi:MAG: hypothetical protein JKY62_12245 [Desulfocapsa sp.]|nr:hypothetical protein [Desulfocapsa sp.]
MKDVFLEIHQTRRFRKQLQAMEKVGKNERNAARRARKIISRLQGDPIDVAAENKRTRHGELRLTQCRKYDLACGFRLISLKRDSRLIFCYIGNHDDCQRWIENNREYKDDMESVPLALKRPDDEQAVPVVTGRVEEDRDEYEEQLMARIDEQMLRTIFSGLCRSS